MKYLLAALMVASVSGCSSPEKLVEMASKECRVIGFDIIRERVPTLECTERGYRIAKQKQSAPLTSLAIGLAVAGAASALQ